MPDVHAYWWDDTANSGLGGWRKTLHLSMWDNSASVWRTLQNCWIWDGAAWRLFFTTAPGHAASVSISPFSVTVDVSIDPNCTFTYSALDQDGVTTTIDAATWSTTDPTGSVDSSGHYTAGTSNGNFDVTVTVNGHASTAAVTVTGNGV